MRELTIDETKKIELDILLSVADFCDKNGIAYFLAYGTLIGAIRHKGFIPWDDDIDIQMPRPDYEKFLKIFNEKNENANLYLVSPDDKMSKHTFSKVIDTRTVKAEMFATYENGELGIDIDIFPIDGQPEDDKTFKKWYKKKHRLYAKGWLATINPEKDGDLKIKLASKLIKLFGTKEKYHNKASEMLKQYPYENSKFVGSTCSFFNSEKNRYSKECFISAIDVPFEGHMLKAPVGYHEILSSMYGDYMALPKDQQPHHLNKCYLKEEEEN